MGERRRRSPSGKKEGAGQSEHGADIEREDRRSVKWLPLLHRPMPFLADHSKQVSALGTGSEGAGNPAALVRLR
jgi:hypothetical protein